MRRILLRRAGVPAADVEDIGQEVFLRLMRYETAELVVHPQAYLYKVVSNVSTEWSMRARNREPHDEQWVASLADNEEPESQTMPAQSEHEIERHPSVATASVFGVPDGDWGEIVVAAVELRDKNVTVSDLIAYVRERKEPVYEV